MTPTTVELQDIQITPELKGVIATPPASAGPGPFICSTTCAMKATMLMRSDPYKKYAKNLVR